MAADDAPLRHAPAWQAIGFLLIALVFYLSLARETIEIPVASGDKAGHMLAYAVLMYWFAQLHPARRYRIALAFVAMGVAIEILQGLTDYRSFEIADMVADATGVGVGWLVAPPRSPHLLRWLESHAIGSS